MATQQQQAGNDAAAIASAALEGYSVAGYVGGSPTEANSRVVAVLAENEIQALVEAQKAHPDFKPVGAMSESEHRRHLQLIEELRAGIGR